LRLLNRALVLFPKSVLIARLAKESGVRNIHAHFATLPALTAYIISELTEISYSITAHAHDIFVDTAMLRQKMERASFVVTISEFNKSYLLKLFPDIPDEKIQVVRCGVEPEHYSCLPLNHPPGRQRNPRILCVASLEPYKGIEYLIRACGLLRRSVQDFQCQIIGDGKDRRRLQALIRKLQLEERVQLLGPRRQDEVMEQLSQADLFVLPSVVARNGQMEGIPVALMEAMASGVPVVASRLSGIPELVEHGKNGLLVPPGDEIALSRALELLCLHGGMRKRFGRQGCEKVVKEFHLRKNVAELDSLLNGSIPLNSVPAPRTNNLPSGLAEQVQQTLWQILSKNKALGSPPELEFRGAVSLGNDSRVCIVQLKGYQEKFILKQHTAKDNPGYAHLCAKREYDVLNHLADSLPVHSSRFRVPEVLAFYPDRRSILMRLCPGETFDKHLRWVRLCRGDVARPLILGSEASGEWLGLFHKVTSQQDSNSKEIKDDIEKGFIGDLNQCAQLGLDQEILSRTSEYFSRRSRSAFNSGAEYVGHHGDYGPQNIFWCAESTYVIDFEGFRTGLPSEDVADFLVLLNLLPFYHADVSLKRRLRNAFLSGYSKHRPLNLESLGLFEVKSLIKRMAHNPHLKQPSAKKIWHRRKILLKSYRKYLERLLA